MPQPSRLIAPDTEQIIRDVHADLAATKQHQEALLATVQRTRDTLSKTTGLLRRLEAVLSAGRAEREPV